MFLATLLRHSCRILAACILIAFWSHSFFGSHVCVVFALLRCFSRGTTWRAAPARGGRMRRAPSHQSARRGRCGCPYWWLIATWSHLQYSWSLRGLTCIVLIATWSHLQYSWSLRGRALSAFARSHKPGLSQNGSGKNGCGNKNHFLVVVGVRSTTRESNAMQVIEINLFRAWLIGRQRGTTKNVKHRSS